MENKNLQKKFHWIYLVGFLLILSLPLLAVPPLFHPAAWGKTIVFRIIFSILIFFFIYQTIFRKNTFILEKLKSKTTRLVLGILTLLLFLFLLSTIFSPEKSFSLWGNPYRGGGFLNFAFCIIFAIFVFLILKPRDWKLVWNFSLGIALLVSFFALLQQFKAFKEFLVSFATRPPATLGATIFLALYLSFFVFLALSFALSEKSKKKKIFYILSFFIITFVIFLTGTRAVFLGLAIGFLYFVLSYPKKIKILKITTLVLLIFGILGVYYINNTPPEKILSQPLIAKSPVLINLLFRFNIKSFLEDPRFTYWKIAADSLKEKPLLGYGPENFSIAFDKYYDPSLPYINYGTISQADRAHGFVFDTAVTAGIPALITFLLLFGVLFWQLEKLKRNKNILTYQQTSEPYNNDKNNPIVAHGIQATIITYFVGVFFSFDTFDTYFMFFLLVGYCLYLISSSKENSVLSQQKETKPYSSLSSFLYKQKKVAISFLFLFLLLFIWSYNLKPLFINKELNWANYYSTNGKCQKAIDKMEKILPSHSIIDHYVLLTYSNVLKDCQETNPEREEELTQKSIQVLEEAIKLRPTYTRTWLLLGSYLNFSVRNNENLKPEEKEELLSKADYYFEKALELNPKGQRILLEKADTYLLWEKYSEAKIITEQCIEINPGMGDCWLQKANANIELGELTEAIENIKKANQNTANIDSRSALSQLLKRYMTAIQKSEEKKLEYYQPLVFVYTKLISFEPKNFQYYASLAYVYKVLGKYWEAYQEALTVIRMSPESKQSVQDFINTFPEEFLKILPNNGQL